MQGNSNPLKAGIVKDILKYKWSSYLEYVGRSKVIDKGFVLNVINSNKNEIRIHQGHTFLFQILFDKVSRRIIFIM